MICFCHFCKKKKKNLYGPYWPLFCVSWAQKWQFLEVLAKIFQNYWITIKVININWIPQHISLETSKKKKNKKTKKATKKNQVWSLGKIWAKLGKMLWKEVKKLTLSIVFSHNLHGEYISKQEVVVVQTPEWKFKANIARNATFQGR